VPQTLQLETDTDSQPLALVVIVETGGEGRRHLRDYDNLGAELDAVIGDVRHLVAVVSFDSKPRIAQDFTDDTDAAAKTIANLHEGDQGAAILDALNFGIDFLRDVPPRYRRAVLLMTETADRGSETSLDDAVRSVSDTNTAIYSFGFSTTKTAAKHEASKVPLPGGTPYGNAPYGAGGCMSPDPGAVAIGADGVYRRERRTEAQRPRVCGAIDRRRILRVYKRSDAEAGLTRRLE
jgi:hypothetical protein